MELIGTGICLYTKHFKISNFIFIRRFDDQLLGYGNVLNGVKIGKQLVVGAGGNSFFIGKVLNRIRGDLN